MGQLGFVTFAVSKVTQFHFRHFISKVIAAGSPLHPGTDGMKKSAGFFHSICCTIYCNANTVNGAGLGLCPAACGRLPNALCPLKSAAA